MAKYDRFHPETAIPQMEKDIEGKADQTDLGDVATEDIVPIPKGGTNANNATSACANLGAITKTLIWQNASPTSEFAAQTISIDLSNYDEVLVEIMGYPLSQPSLHVYYAVSTTMIRKGDPLKYIVVPSAQHYIRGITVTNSGITFTTGYGQPYWGQSATTESNFVAVPLKIYGIKNVQ